MRLSGEAECSVQLDVIGELVEGLVGRVVEDPAQVKKLHELGDALQDVDGHRFKWVDWTRSGHDDNRDV